MQKLKKNEARPKCTGSYEKKRVLYVMLVESCIVKRNDATVTAT